MLKERGKVLCLRSGLTVSLVEYLHWLWVGHWSSDCSGNEGCNKGECERLELHFDCGKDLIRNIRIRKRSVRKMEI